MTIGDSSHHSSCMLQRKIIEKVDLISASLVANSRFRCWSCCFLTRRYKIDSHLCSPREHGNDSIRDRGDERVDVDGTSDARTIIAALILLSARYTDEVFDARRRSSTWMFNKYTRDYLPSHVIINRSMLEIVYLQRCNGDLFTINFLPLFVALFIITHAVYLCIDTRRLLLIIFSVVVYHTSKSTDNTFNRRLTSPSLSLSLSLSPSLSPCVSRSLIYECLWYGRLAHQQRKITNRSRSYVMLHDVRKLVLCFSPRSLSLSPSLLCFFFFFYFFPSVSFSLSRHFLSLHSFCWHRSTIVFVCCFSFGLTVNRPLYVCMWACATIY